MKPLHRAAALLALVMMPAVLATPAAAQAIVPAAGEGMVSVTFQHYEHTGHFDRLGHKNTNGATQSEVLVTHVDFGLPKQIGVSANLPFISSKYTGPPSYFVEGNLTLPGPLDDRTYHSAFQDVRVEVRRMWVTPVAMVAPFAALSVPTHDYETVGEAVPGRHRIEGQIGVAAIADLDAVLPRTYVEAQYAYATLERVNGFPHTRSNIDIEGTHQLLSRLAVRGLVGWQIRHQGPTVGELVPDWIHHDRFINSNYVNLGAGASVFLGPATEVYGLWLGTVRGNRGAHVARVLAIGVSRAFGGRFHGL